MFGLKGTVRIAVCLAALALVAGCTTYYEVSDPTSGKTYYTTRIEDLRSGARKLTDEKTGTEVTVQTSEVHKISKEKYEAALHAPAPTSPSDWTSYTVPYTAKVNTGYMRAPTDLTAAGTIPAGDTVYLRTDAATSGMVPARIVDNQIVYIRRSDLQAK